MNLPSILTYLLFPLQSFAFDPTNVFPSCLHAGFTWEISQVDIAWLSLCFILERSWVALYSDVCVWGIGVTWPNLHFFQYIQAYKPFADHVPPNIKQYQLILTKYQPVSSYTDPVPSSTTYNSSSCKAQLSQLNNFSFYDSFDESRTVYLV